MENVLLGLQSAEIWIYVLLGAVGIFFLRKLIIELEHLHASLFGMEREIAQRQLTATITVLVIVGLFALGEFMVATFVAPAFPSVQLPTPTLNLAASPTPTLGALLTPTLSGVIGSTPTPLVQEGCTPKVVEWSYPPPGEEVSGRVTLKGTVNLDNLGFYKYEYSTPGSTTWSTIAADNTKKVDEDLGIWDTTTLTPGDYLLRLVVTDSQNQLLPACVVTVRVVAPPQ